MMISAEKNNKKEFKKRQLVYFRPYTFFGQIFTQVFFFPRKNDVRNFPSFWWLISFPLVIISEDNIFSSDFQRVGAEIFVKYILLI